MWIFIFIIIFKLTCIADGMLLIGDNFVLKYYLSSTTPLFFGTQYSRFYLTASLSASVCSAVGSNIKEKHREGAMTHFVTDITLKPLSASNMWFIAGLDAQREAKKWISHFIVASHSVHVASVYLFF